MKETGLRSFTSGFKRVFKQERIKAGYTQESFAISFGVSLDTVRNWEQGRTVPEIKTLEALCAEFGCEPDYLLGRMQHSTHDEQFICSATGLNEDSVANLHRLSKDRATMAVINHLLSNTGLLKQLVLFFAAEFFDIDRRIEFKLVPYEHSKVDKDVRFAGLIREVSRENEMFYGIHKNDPSIVWSMLLRLMDECTYPGKLKSCCDKLKCLKREDLISYSDEQLGVFAELLIYRKEGDKAHLMDCDLKNFVTNEEASNSGTD